MLYEVITPAVCLVVGPSNGGKTTLVEKLLLELKGRSLTVATAKGHKHKIELDRVGKDSWRHRRAGSVLTFLVTEGETAAFMDPSFSSDPDMLRITSYNVCYTKLLRLRCGLRRRGHFRRGFWGQR